MPLNPTYSIPTQLELQRMGPDPGTPNRYTGLHPCAACKQYTSVSCYSGTLKMGRVETPVTIYLCHRCDGVSQHPKAGVA